MLREKRKQIGKETENNHEQRNFYHIGRPGRRRKNNADSDDEGILGRPGENRSSYERTRRNRYIRKTSRNSFRQRKCGNVRYHRDDDLRSGQSAARGGTDSPGTGAWRGGDLRSFRGFQRSVSGIRKRPGRCGSGSESVCHGWAGTGQNLFHGFGSGNRARTNRERCAGSYGAGEVGFSLQSL